MSETEALMSTKRIFATNAPSKVLNRKHENKENLYELKVYFVRTLIRFYAHSNNSKSLLIIQNSASSVLKYSCSPKPTFAQCTIFFEGTLQLLPLHWAFA